MRLVDADVGGDSGPPGEGVDTLGTRSPGDVVAAPGDVVGGDVGHLYAVLIPDAVRLAYLLSGDHALAEDIAHEAFLRVAARRHRLSDPGTIAGYLRRAVVNEVHSGRRSLLRRLAREERAAVGRRPDPSATDQVEQRRDLVDALQRLPLRQRTAILLRYWLDLSDAQIADTMGCPIGTVKSSLSRGLESLRKAASDRA